MFKNREDAGQLLAEKLVRFKDEDVVVLAIPRGGIPLASIIAKKLRAPLDISLSKKIGHPLHKEFAIGAVSLENMILMDTPGITQEYIENEVKQIRKKLKERYHQYYQHRSPVDLKDKTVIVVDDGIATGNTLLATVELIRNQHPKKIVIAIPVASKSSIQKFENNPKVNETICLLVPYHFRSVGQFYEEFDQVSDQEAIAFLESHKNNITQS